MVPVLATGFKDLEKRKTAQEEQMKLFEEKRTELVDKIESLARHHHGVTLVRINEYRRKQRDIVHSVLKVHDSFDI